MEFVGQIIVYSDLKGSFFKEISNKVKHLICTDDLAKLMSMRGLQVESYALEISRLIIPMNCLLVKVFCNSVLIFDRQLYVPLFFLKPHCSGMIKFIFSMNQVSRMFMIFSINLHKVLTSEIGGYPSGVNLSFPGLLMGIIMLFLQFWGNV